MVSLRERSFSPIRELGIGDPDYPPLLHAIHDPPALVYARGSDVRLLCEPVVAIVGSRRATDHGRCVAAEIASFLAGRGVVVASGMAYGIDAAAHRGALQGGGQTIAVWACGLDVIYPPSHAELASRIEESGLVLSEFPPGTEPRPEFFPQRNRIISGLSIATIIVEAAEKSGSLITARLALEQGREVMAVPGRAGEVNSRGTNRLIRDGAALVESGSDVLEIIERWLPVGPGAKMTGLLGIDVDKDTPLLGAMKGAGAVCVDWLVGQTKLCASEILEALTRLVLAGQVVELPGRRFRLKGS